MELAMSKPDDRDTQDGSLEEFEELVRNPAIRSVSRWVLPNKDTPFDSTTQKALFASQLDDFFNLSTRAIKGISAKDEETGS